MKDLRLVDFLMGYSERPLAMLYLVFAWSLTLKNFGLSVEAQLIAQRILTPLLLVALQEIIVLIKPVCLAGLVKENGITCDMGKFGKMNKGVKEAIRVNPCKMGVSWGLSPKDSSWFIYKRNIQNHAAVATERTEVMK